MQGHHLNRVSLAGRLWPAFSGIWIIPTLIKLKKVFKIGPPLTKISGSAHVVGWTVVYDCGISLSYTVAFCIYLIEDVRTGRVALL